MARSLMAEPGSLKFAFFTQKWLVMVKCLSYLVNDVFNLILCIMGLLLERKAMTNLDSVLKSRDIIFLTKVLIVKAMVFPVAICECESWTIKKSEH